MYETVLECRQAGTSLPCACGIEPFVCTHSVLHEDVTSRIMQRWMFRARRFGVSPDHRMRTCIDVEKTVDERTASRGRPPHPTIMPMHVRRNIAVRHSTQRTGPSSSQPRDRYDLSRRTAQTHRALFMSVRCLQHRLNAGTWCTWDPMLCGECYLSPCNRRAHCLRMASRGSHGKVSKESQWN